MLKDNSESSYVSACLASRDTDCLYFRLFFKDTCLAKHQESGTVSHTGVKGKSFYWSYVIEIKSPLRHKSAGSLSLTKDSGPSAQASSHIKPTTCMQAASYSSHCYYPEYKPSFSLTQEESWVFCCHPWCLEG